MRYFFQYVCALVTLLMASDAQQEPRRTRRTKDGRLFFFDLAANAWRLEEDPTLVAVPTTGPGSAQAALPWRQFSEQFDGEFAIDGVPLILPSEQPLRSQDEQQHADTGRNVWDGAVVLAKLLEQNKHLLFDREVLELGAGRGVVGLAATRFARRVVMTDLAYTMEGLREAVELNKNVTRVGSFASVSVAELDWASPEAFLDTLKPSEAHFDIVVAADVVWLLELVPLLVSALAGICNRLPSVQIIVVHQLRAENVKNEFLSSMAENYLALSWELVGGSGSNTAMVGGSELRWHPDYVPDHRFSAWGFEKQQTAEGSEAALNGRCVGNAAP